MCQCGSMLNANASRNFSPGVMRGTSAVMFMRTSLSPDLSPGLPMGLVGGGVTPGGVGLLGGRDGGTGDSVGFWAIAIGANISAHTAATQTDRRLGSNARFTAVCMGIIISMLTALDESSLRPMH